MISSPTVVVLRRMRALPITLLSLLHSTALQPLCYCHIVNEAILFQEPLICRLQSMKTYVLVTYNCVLHTSTCTDKN